MILFFLSLKHMLWILSIKSTSFSGEIRRNLPNGFVTTACGVKEMELTPQIKHWLVKCEK